MIKTFTLVIVIALSNTSMAQVLDSNNYSIQLILETKSTSADSIVYSLNNIGLPEIEISKMDTNKIQLNFSSNFDSLVTQNLKNYVSLRIEERYDFTEVSTGLSPIMPYLAMSGDRTTKYLLDYCKRPLTPNQENHPYLGPLIGEFYRGDTALVNELIRINNEKSKEELPSDLSFLWNLSSKKDTLQLYLGKKRKGSDHVTENDIISICASVKEIKEWIDFDQNENPTEWSTYSSYEILLKFDTIGTQIFKDLTYKMQGQYLTISVNDNIFSTPVIYMPINNGQVTISAVEEEFLFRFYSMLLFKNFDKNFKLIKFEIKRNSTNNIYKNDR